MPPKMATPVVRSKSARAKLSRASGAEATESEATRTSRSVDDVKFQRLTTPLESLAARLARGESFYEFQDVIMAENDGEEGEGEEKHMATDEKLTTVPPGLTAEQAKALPNRLETEARIKAINGAKLLEKIVAYMSEETHTKLGELKRDHKNVELPAVQRALDKCNQSNKEVAKSPLITPVQEHATGLGAHGVVDGTFPTTTAMPSKVTLSATNNATVITLALLEGVLPTEFADGMIRINRMPTTRPTYTDVPTQAEFKSFQPAHVEALSDLFAAGVQMYDAISDTCRPDFIAAVHGKAPPKFVVLVELNGATLELHTPDGKPPVLATFPFEHASHIAWQVRLPACPPCNHPGMHLHSPFIHPRSAALSPSRSQAMKEETRLWVLEGLVTVYAARAALLCCPPPLVDKLLGVIGGAPLKKWYKGGAYCEAVMKTVRRAQFRAVYGDDDGDKRWRQWYKDCKSRAGT